MKSAGNVITMGLILFVFVPAFGSEVLGKGSGSEQLNVILIMTDDQGYGDVGIHGNERIRTPNLDRLAGEGIRLHQFHVSPVCTPTRASLMTGRYNYRTRAIDTYLGRAMMDGEEVTLAEILSARGYRTGIFGKWHLGDNYPLRAIDQGFQESLVHGGGGLTQPGDYPGNRYLDPVLLHNGKHEQTEGYCSDVYTRAAMKFIEKQKGAPFFVYLAFNAPHTPLEVPEEWVEPYLREGLDETTAKIYAMITNVDENLGRMDDHLRTLGLFEKTLVIFLTDNGPQQQRYTGGMRGQKGTVYEGGTRVPCFLRRPGQLEAGKVLNTPAAHLDLLPTILTACDLELPTGLKIDGVSLWKHLQGGEAPGERDLVFQWHRGDRPLPYQACTIRRGRFKLVQSKFLPEVADADQLPWELFDLESDPAESRNLAKEQPEEVKTLREAYRRWFDDVSSTRGYDPPRIVVGSDHENPSILTRQDWRGFGASWDRKGIGHWQIRVEGEGTFTVTLRFPVAPRARNAVLKVGTKNFEMPVAAGMEKARWEGIELPRGELTLEGVLIDGETRSGPHYVDVLRN